MLQGLFGRAFAALAVSMALATGAVAQNYDGNGLVRFGVFGAWESYDLNATGGNGSVSMDGGAVGFAAGYDMIFGRQFVAGIEADLQLGDTRGTLAGIAAHADYLATVRGRLGVFLGPQFLIYGTGGVAWAGLGIENTIGTATSDLDSNKTVTGWVAGGGIEMNVGEIAGFGTLLFAEYLVAGFDNWKSAPGTGFDIDAEVQTVRIGVKLKLGHDYHEDRGSHRPMK